MKYLFQVIRQISQILETGFLTEEEWIERLCESIEEDQFVE